MTQEALRDPKTLSVRTFTYKTVGSLDIKADVRRPEDDVLRPAVLWMHGGALIVGNREWLDGHLKNPLLRMGYVFVSIDYRLAPETRLPEIVTDIVDAYDWIRREGPELFGADSSRPISVAGSSAGGYLALTAGFRCSPRPASVTSFYGYGELIGLGYDVPSPHERHYATKMSDDEARSICEGPPVSEDRERDGDGGAFYLYCRQRGIFPYATTGIDPRRDPQAYTPFRPIANVDGCYPPTILVHGTADTDVLYAQSKEMAKSLKIAGVQYELVSVSGAEHGLEGASPAELAAAYEAALSFIHRHAPTSGLPATGLR